jgi:hypothetical protein
MVIVRVVALPLEVLVDWQLSDRFRQVQTFLQAKQQFLLQRTLAQGKNPHGSEQKA